MIDLGKEYRKKLETAGFPDSGNGAYSDSLNYEEWFKFNSATLITLADVGIAFLAGLIIFPFVFSSGIETQGGPGLIFQVFPQIFQDLGGTTGIIIGSTFFILLSFAAITSTVSLLELFAPFLLVIAVIPPIKITPHTADMMICINLQS